VSRFGVALSAIALVCGACSPGATDEAVPDGTSSQDSSVIAKGDYQRLTSLEASFDAGDDGRYQITRAIERRIAECMNADGFAYDQPPPTQVSNGRRPFWEANFGLFDNKTAQEHGYSVAPLDDPGFEQPSTEPAYISALFGDDSGQSIVFEDPFGGATTGSLSVPNGCVGKATLAVYGDSDTWQRFQALDLGLQGQMYEILTEVRASQSLIDLNNDWADCMSVIGWTYATPIDPFSRQFPEPRPTAEELDIAIADVRCKEELDYQEAVITLVREREDDVGDSVATGLAEFTNLYDSIVRRSNDLLTE
jgi:hypothetical protein